MFLVDILLPSDLQGCCAGLAVNDPLFLSGIPLASRTHPCMFQGVTHLLIHSFHATYTLPFCTGCFIGFIGRNVMLWVCSKVLSLAPLPAFPCRQQHTLRRQALALGAATVQGPRQLRDCLVSDFPILAQTDTCLEGPHVEMSSQTSGNTFLCLKLQGQVTEAGLGLREQSGWCHSGAHGPGLPSARRMKPLTTMESCRSALQFSQFYSLNSEP